MSARYVCLVSGLCFTEKERKGARAGERNSQTGLLFWELKRRPVPGASVGSSTQILKRPSMPMEAMRLGWMVGGNQWIFHVLDMGSSWRIGGFHF